jgi:hypothetical protein
MAFLERKSPLEAIAVKYNQFKQVSFPSFPKRNIPKKKEKRQYSYRF